MTISKLASDVVENHWETKGMKHALQTERDYNLMTSQKLERLKVKLYKCSSLGGKGGGVLRRVELQRILRFHAFVVFFILVGYLVPISHKRNVGHNTPYGSIVCNLCGFTNRMMLRAFRDHLFYQRWFVARSKAVVEVARAFT